MKSRNPESWLLAAALLLMLLAVPMLTIGCTFNPAKYFSRNACEFVNCNVLFFVEDVFPLSAGPTGGGAAPTEAEADEAEDEGAAHVH